MFHFWGSWMKQISILKNCKTFYNWTSNCFEGFLPCSSGNQEHLDVGIDYLLHHFFSLSSLQRCIEKKKALPCVKGHVILDNTVLTITVVEEKNAQVGPKEKKNSCWCKSCVGLLMLLFWNRFVLNKS